MGFGIRMRKLWHLRAGVAVSLALAVVASVWSLAQISLLPPGLTPRKLEMATASTHVVVDTPKSALLDLRQSTYSFEGLRNRAVLLGNVMASASVRADIARRAHVPVELIQVAAPRTPEQPRAVVGSADDHHTTDILKSNDQYRLSIQANPTVPVLDIYAQTPTAKSAADLANAAVDELRGYLGGLASSEKTPAGDQIRLVQLGRAKGAVINPRTEWQVAFLAFLVTFGVCCATVLFLARLRAGWKLATLSEQTTAG
jgi:hypothetical protein